MAFCESFLIQMKWQSQPYILHLSSIYRRHRTRTRPVSVRSLTTEVIFVRFYLRKTFIIIELMVRTLYVYDYDDEK